MGEKLVGALFIFFAIGAGVCAIVLLSGALRGAVEDANETPESVEKNSHIEL